MFKAIIFDMDGTLLDTLEDLADCMNRVLAANNFQPHETDRYRYYVGDGMEKLVLRALPEKARHQQTIDRLKAAMTAEYSAHWADKTRPYAGIPELLDRLTNSRVRMAILSNKPHRFTEMMAARFFKPWPLEIVLGARDGVPRKPDSTAALEICRRFGLSTAQTLYVGDTNTDMHTAAAAEIFAVGVLWGFRGKEELIASGARELVENPEDLLKFF